MAKDETEIERERESEVERLAGRSEVKWSAKPAAAAVAAAAASWVAQDVDDGDDCRRRDVTCVADNAPDLIQTHTHMTYSVCVCVSKYGCPFVCVQNLPRYTPPSSANDIETRRL